MSEIDKLISVYEECARTEQSSSQIYFLRYIRGLKELKKELKE